MNTQRYHGLLTAATRPAVGRFVLLSKFEGKLLISDEQTRLMRPKDVSPRLGALRKSFAPQLKTS
jgi:hypothetical protein